MNKISTIIPVAVAALAAVATAASADETDNKIAAFKSPTYYLMQHDDVNLSDFAIDEQGYTVIFDGSNFNGWRGYGRDTIPGRWVLDNGAMHFIGKKNATPANGDGGDLLFSYKFKNFELDFEWMVAEGSNSGVFYLVQETMTPNGGDRSLFLQYAASSAPEYQILDNVGHPDGKLGKDGNRCSASLYDLIPAVPQNAKKPGEWNTAKIIVNNGKVEHWQNGVKVLGYELWTPQWVRMLAESKFGPGEWDIAFELMREAGGKDHKGYITLQDHGDDVWYRNFRVKDLGPGKEIGVQLYSVREPIGELLKENKSIAPILTALAAMGYTSIEAANYNDGKFYGMEPAEFAKALAAAGLSPLSSHTSRQLTADELKSGNFTGALAWWKQTIADHKKAGFSYIVFPWMSVPKTTEDLATLCKYLNAVGAMCKEAGIGFGYHNHAHEFNKVGDNVMLDYMLANTDPENVFFQLDVYWAMMGKASAVEYFKKYPGRFKLLHIKDKLEVGQSGMVGFDAIFDNAGTAGVQDIIVEAEGSSYGDIMRTMKESADYLLAAPFVKASYNK